VLTEPLSIRYAFVFIGFLSSVRIAQSVQETAKSRATGFRFPVCISFLATMSRALFIGYQGCFPGVKPAKPELLSSCENNNNNIDSIGNKTF
jgi:hypothetical protein